MTRRTSGAARGRWVAAAAILASIACPAAAASQVAALDMSTLAHNACADTVTPQRFVTTTIFQSAVSADTLSALTAQLDLISQQVAARARAVLGAGPNMVPEDDTLANWRHLSGTLPLEVVFYRDRPSVWRVDSAADTSSARLLAVYSDVLRQMSPNDLWVVWPPGFASDSVVLRFALGPNDPPRATHQPRFAVFSLPMGVVAQSHALPNHVAHPQYPYDAEFRRVIATLTMDFVIDTTGHPDSTTLKDETPPPKVFDFPRAEMYYREFVAATRKAILASTFHPARYGGCAVRELVRAPYAFRFRP